MTTITIGTDSRPVLSLSTVCESLNTVLNLNHRNSGFILRNLATIIPAIIPWLFYHEVERTRELSLNFLKPLAKHIADGRLLDTAFQAQLKDRYRNDLLTLLANETEKSTTEALEIWSFLIKVKHF